MTSPVPAAGAAAAAAPAAPVAPPAPLVPHAEVIDISGSLGEGGEEFYDQYADAKLRAVGDLPIPRPRTAPPKAFLRPSEGYGPGNSGHSSIALRTS